MKKISKKLKFKFYKKSVNIFMNIFFKNIYFVTNMQKKIKKILCGKFYKNVNFFIKTNFL